MYVYLCCIVYICMYIVGIHFQCQNQKNITYRTSTKKKVYKGLSRIVLRSQIILPGFVMKYITYYTYL